MALDPRSVETDEVQMHAAAAMPGVIPSRDSSAAPRSASRNASWANTPKDTGSFSQPLPPNPMTTSLPSGNPQRSITLPSAGSAREEDEELSGGDAATMCSRRTSDCGGLGSGNLKKLSSGNSRSFLSVKGAFSNQGWGCWMRRPCDDSVAALLDEVIALGPADKGGKSSRSGGGSIRESKRSAGDEAGCQEGAVELTESMQDANYTIFTEEGSYPRFCPVIGFLSPFALWWDRIRMLVSLWTLTYTPVMLAFHGRYDGFSLHPAAQAFDVFSDVVFLVGSLLSFITTVGSVSAGREYVSLELIWRKRLRSPWFWGDIVSCIPFLMGLCAGELPTPSSTTLRRAHLVKLFRMGWVLDMPASHFETKFWSLLPLIHMFVWIMLSIHLSACLWYVLVVNSGTLDWHLAEISTTSESSHYLVAFKCGVYMVTGKPVETYSDDELIMFALMSPLGGIFFAFIYGNTTMLLTRYNIHMSKHHKHMALIQRTMKTLGLPLELRQRINKYHHFLAVHHNINAYSLLMQGLSVNLFIELKAHLFKKMFSEGPFFTGAPASFLRNLLQVMVEVTFCPGDVVIRCGDMGDQMYFVVKGRLDVLSTSNSVIGKISENQYFGEVALLISTPRLVSIRASTYCLLGMIQRDGFVPILDAYPEQKHRMLDAMKLYKNPEVHETKDETDIGNVASHAEDDRCSLICAEEEDRPSCDARQSRAPLEAGKEPSERETVAAGGARHFARRALSLCVNRDGNDAPDAPFAELEWHTNRRNSDRGELLRRRASALPRLGLLGGKAVHAKESAPANTATGKAAHFRDAVFPSVSWKSTLSRRSSKLSTDRSESVTRARIRRESKFSVADSSVSGLEERRASDASSVVSSVGRAAGVATPIVPMHTYGALHNSGSAHAAMATIHRHSVGGRCPGLAGPASSGKAPELKASSKSFLGEPAQGRVLHPASATIASKEPSASLLHDSVKWSLIADMMLDRIEEIVDERVDRPLREMSQQMRALQQGLSELRAGAEANQRLPGAGAGASMEGASFEGTRAE